jgi:beta-glucanase (GH16 family)
MPRARARALSLVLVAGATLGAGTRPVDGSGESGGRAALPPTQRVETSGGEEPRPTGPIGEDRSWRLVFDDEFDAAVLDPSVWAPCYWWAEDACTNAGNRELQCYTPAGVSVERGMLRLRAEERTTECDGELFGYRSGMVSGIARDGPPQIFQHGFFEMRARVPSGKGLLPAFWLLPASENSEPEIDVMEILGDTPQVVRMHYHWRDGDDEERSIGAEWSGEDMSTGWHTFAVHWTRRRLSWFVDGVARWSVSADEALLPTEPMYLLATLAVGGDYPGSPDGDTAFPATFEIDYIRAWRECRGR